MPNYQDGADAYGAYTQGSHIGGVIRKRYMGSNQLADARKLQARDGTAATAIGAGGLSSRPAESTGRKAVMEAMDREERDATMRAAQAGAARATAEMATPVSKPAAKPDPVPATRPPIGGAAKTAAAALSAAALRTARQKKAMQDRNFSRHRVALENGTGGKHDSRLDKKNLPALREAARASGDLDNPPGTFDWQGKRLKKVPA